MRVKRSECALLVIDVQDRLIDTIVEHAAVMQNIRALIKASEVLTVSVLVTKQEKLGEIAPELVALISKSPSLKLSFSCCGDSEFMTRLKANQKRALIVVGIETHICVLQTVLDLLKLRYRVLIARDATSSHTLIDRDSAIERMRNSGAIITTTEAIIYELTEKAGTEEFREILEIVKERRNAFSS